MWATSVPALLTSLLLLLSPASAASSAPKDAVLLSKVKSLTFKSNSQTTARRVKPIPQMQCIGPANICKLYSVDTMRCMNSGSDYDEENVQWTCTASLSPEFKLGSTDVSCEGYAGSEDPYVLKGSCGVEYRLLLTEIGEEKYGKKPLWGGSKSKGSSKSSKTNEGITSEGTNWFFWAVFLIVIGVIVYSAFSSNNNGGPPRFGGGGNGGGNDDPPPPYDSRDYGAPPRKPRTARTGRTSTSGSSSRAAGEQWRPGFWTGAATGAAAGYLAGNRGNSSRQQTRPAMQEQGGGWFSNNNRGGGNGGSSGSSSSPGPSTNRYEGTGFGSTNRR